MALENHGCKVSRLKNFESRVEEGAFNWSSFLSEILLSSRELWCSAYVEVGAEAE
ncbi:unnamed protein product [Rhodiola kirilowii]